MPEPVEVALVSLGTTAGLRRADEAFAAGLRASGISCELRQVAVGRAGVLRRTPAMTDLVEALAARRAANPVDTTFTIYSTVTAALLQRHTGPYAVRFDAPAALNRRGIGGAWQRRAERRALRGARFLLPWSERAAEAAAAPIPHVVVPVPIAEEPTGGAVRDIDALAYAANPRKRGLDIVCAAWAKAPPGARLVIGGIERAEGMRWLKRAGVAEPAGVEWHGPVSHREWLATVGRARLFVNASRWEDYGISQLEALSAGAALVTLPSPGPYEALACARRLAPDLVDDDLGAALGKGLELGDAELERYRVRARAELAPYRPDAVLAVVRERVAPLLRRSE